ncbi:hypothetical protein [Sphingobacterium athyrii]|uniref:Uncharacterized protein n=1 Tax=Sphingobacterium athyrii TaxID=2152717 RepID=A0A363NQ67_9SPHI|nr:hypothetical protein [Sphingobacterium athyrii]PUV22945.1 hypothetical protein DCO56_18665 [Sphingobacterium athyrii]
MKQIQKILVLTVSLTFAFHFQVLSQKSSLQEYKNNFTSFYSTANKLASSKDSWNLYILGPFINSVNNIYSITKDDYYLDCNLKLIKQLIQHTDPSNKFGKSQFKDQYLGWANHSHPESGNDGKEYPLFESYCWRYVTEILLIINNDARLKRKYKNDYNLILNFTEKNIFEKWYSRGRDHIYRSNLHMRSHWARICFDLYLITKKNKYKIVFDNFDDILLKRLGNVNRTKSVNTNLNSPNYLEQDLPHANALVGYMFHRERYNKKLNKVLRSFYTAFYDNSFHKDHMSLYLQGGSKTMNISDGFIMYGRFNKELQNDFVNFRPKSELNIAQYLSNMALNEYYLNR